ncbi:hypothetical protein GCM10011488_60070 [Steroidobacter agaridevorans]|nr:hypothetical protein GCM10011488_60070 [Steroidobacter agaridevorans]
MAEEFGVQVPELGIDVAFNLDALIDRIYWGPLLGDKQIEAIRSTAEEAGLGRRVRVSSLLGTPRYT